VYEYDTCVYAYKNFKQRFKKLTQVVQHDSPAALGRKARIEELLKLILTERLNKSEQQIIALYMLKTGLRSEIVKSYLRLIYASALYVQPDYLTDKILTEQERIPLQNAWQREHDIQDTIREILHERYHVYYIDKVLEAQYPGIKENVRKEAEKIVDSLNQ